MSLFDGKTDTRESHRIYYYDSSTVLRTTQRISRRYLYLSSDYRQRQLQSVQAENKALSELVANMEQRIQAREDEIERLGKLVRGTQHMKHAAQIQTHYDHESKSVEYELERDQLNYQLDVLNAQVAKYEKKLTDAASQIQRNAMLTNQVRHAQSLNEQYLVEMSQLRLQLSQLQEELARGGGAGAVSPRHQDQQHLNRRQRGTGPPQRKEEEIGGSMKRITNDAKEDSIEHEVQMYKDQIHVRCLCLCRVDKKHVATKHDQPSLCIEKNATVLVSDLKYSILKI
jgi:hypothetical protein